MYNANFVSVIGFLSVILIIVLQRKVIFSWSVISVFFLSNLIFVISGVLVLPWILSFAQQTFPTFNLALLSDRDLSLAILLSAGGTLLVLFWYQCAHLVFSGGKIFRRGPNIMAPFDPGKVGIYSKRVIMLSLGAMLLTLFYVATNLSVFLTGIRDLVLGGQASSTLEARQSATQSYVYVLLVFNIIPFFGIIVWLLSKAVGGLMLRIYAIFYNVSASIFLLSVFQKRPIIIFLACWFLASVSSNSTLSHRIKSQLKSRLKSRSPRKWLRMLLYGGALFAVLLGLYYVQLRSFRPDESLVTTLRVLSGTALTRIFGRLSLPSAFYAHYFPLVDPHYGLTNLGLFSRIFGFELYKDTPEVFQYFTRRDEGSVAVSALVDFYGAFGLYGWFVGTILLGILLERMDMWLLRLRPTAATMTLIIFMFVFVYYLSQASVARSLLGYGGGIWMFLWFIIRRPVRTRVPAPIRHTAPASEGSPGIA